MMATMIRSLSIALALPVIVVSLWGCPRRPTAKVPSEATASLPPATARDVLAAAVTAVVAAQLDLAPDQVLWDASISRQPRAGDDVDLQEILNRLNEDLNKDCTTADLRMAVNVPTDQELAGTVTPQLLNAVLARSPSKNAVTLPDPNTTREIPAQPE